MLIELQMCTSALTQVLIYPFVSSTTAATMTAGPHHISELIARSSLRCFDAECSSVQFPYTCTESEDRRCGGQLRQNGHGVDTARRTSSWITTAEEGLTMALLTHSKFGDHELQLYTEVRSAYAQVRILPREAEMVTSLRRDTHLSEFTSLDL